MSAELQEFNEVIEDLKSVINESRFDQEFKAKTSNIPKGKQFLIKMELKRLAQPCNRLIDLRGNVVGEVIEYEYKGQTHYLDEIAKNIFEEQLEKFGQYTLGGYEAVLGAENNHRVMHKNEQRQRIAEKQQTQSSSPSSSVPSSEKHTSSGTCIHFTNYGFRKEERMNFAVEIELQFGLGDVLKAQSSDLSVNGLKVKVPSVKKVIEGQKLTVYLTGLQKEFELGLSNGLQYEVVGLDSINSGYRYVRMKRIFDEDTAAFDEFLSHFINGNKNRYKLNIENTLEAVKIKGYEQFYLPRITSLPVYIREINGRLLPTMSLATENNRANLGYFSDENKNLIFQQILTEKRLKMLRAQQTENMETILFCFTHARGGRLYFYTATAEELEVDSKLKNTFIGFGSQKPSWKVFKLQLKNVSEHDAHIQLTIPEAANEQIKKLNRPPSPKVQGLLKNLRYMALFTPLSKNGQNDEYSQHYQYDKSEINTLSQFGHPKLKRYINIEVETIDYINLRAEERYLYKSPVEMEQPDNESEPIMAHTRDISNSGLQLVLDTPCSYNKGDIVVLGLPELQKLSSKFNLTKIAYEVVAISRDKTVMNLKAYEPKGTHQGKKFFKKLINQNRTKLTPAQLESRYPGLSTALRNIIARHVANTPMYLTKDGPKLSLTSIGRGDESNLLHKILHSFKPDNADVSLFPFTKNNAVNSIYTPIIQKMERADKPHNIDLYVRYREDQEGEAKTFICQYDSSFMNESMLSSFVNASAKNDILFVFRVYLSKTGRPDTSYLLNEMKYIHRYYQHKAKALESSLWAVSAIGDVIDITDEVIYRFGCDSQILNQQANKKNQLAKTLSI